MTDQPQTRAAPLERPRFPIVGIGASAGGLVAFEAFFSAMPADSGMAFVLVQHLAPDRESALSELLGRHTTMPVVDVEDGVAVQPDHVYVIPPDRDMALLDGALQLLEPAAPRGLRLPIDFFFHSLAEQQRERAICIVLSGTGSDGALGLRAVKGEGGLTVAQEPTSAAYDGMPRTAIATGSVDAVCEPAEMPARLLAYARLRFGDHPGALVASGRPSLGEDTLRKVCMHVRAHTGHDFSQYKETTLVRRIARRMALHQIEREEDYLRFLQKQSAEVEALFGDLLINVTRFFRDPAAFNTLETEVLPALLQRKAAGATLRVWVAGCSTGEEAYSIAMLVQEQLARSKQHYGVQVFASDIDAEAIARARAGVYPQSIAADVSPARLERFFVKDAASDGYRVTKLIRDLLVFSEQDMIRDPPFSRLDLISCRNLLIYMTPQLQKKLIPLFHYALVPGGALLLGSSETVGEFSDLFEPVDRRHKLYQRRGDDAAVPRLALPAFATEHQAPGALAIEARRDPGHGDEADLRPLTERALLDHHAHVGVLVNGRGEILHIYGRTGQYLEPAAGDAQMNILQMAREGLRRPLTMALHKAVGKRAVAHQERLRVRTNGASKLVDLTVRPLPEPTAGAFGSDLWLVVIVPREEEAESPAADLDPARGRELDERTAALEQELRAKEEYLQTTLEEMETSNEELKSTNEELQSVNEELQSSNEEMETSKEELQSVNEELATVNAELQTKVSELSRANNDMNNLLAGTGVGTLFVDHQLRIARFTPAATQVINLIPSDVGRPVGHVVSNLVDYQHLVRDVQEVLDSLAPLEREVQTTLGSWYLMRIRPYRTLDNVIEGVVITFVDISSRKFAELAHREAEAFAASIVSAVREPLVVLDETLDVVDANAAYYRAFAVSQAETVGRSLYELHDGQWDIPELRELLEQVLPDDQSFDDFEVEHDFERVGARSLKLNARRITRSGERGDLILLAIELERG